MSTCRQGNAQSAYFQYKQTPVATQRNASVLSNDYEMYRAGKKEIEKEEDADFNEVEFEEKERSVHLV